MNDLKTIKPILSLYTLNRAIWRCPNEKCMHKYITKNYEKNIVSSLMIKCTNYAKYRQKRLKKIWCCLDSYSNDFIKLMKSKTITDMFMSHKKICKDTRLPPNLEKIRTNGDQICKIPLSVKYLHFDRYSIHNGVLKLPPKIKIFHSDTHKIIPTILTLSRSLKYFSLSLEYNCPLPKFYNQLLIVDIKSKCGDPINDLPNSLQIIKLSLPDDYQYWEQLLDNLPSSVKFLQLLRCDYPINFLPQSLEALIIEEKFNYPIKNLPRNLKFLILSDHFNYPFETLPQSIEHIIINNMSYCHLEQLFSLLPETIINIGIFSRGLSYEFDQYEKHKQLKKYQDPKYIFNVKNTKFKIFFKYSDYLQLIEKYKKKAFDMIKSKLY